MIVLNTVQHEDETKDKSINNKILDHSEIKIEIKKGSVTEIPTTILPNWLPHPLILKSLPLQLTT
ncbi:MAG: hypothetical protein DCC88_02100 [Spirobacillus cienkowskii]|jgi:hypothetical protein|uniref:Uncharacterized protein n=1 Tax=Spirobacillus cienkowskii TaxID=495820 RepID=A0A369KTU8_9BACT|nr:MAG: hypothetical protein DCC88_02100 [Spirobacillus cienkowskii]